MISYKKRSLVLLILQLFLLLPLVANDSPRTPKIVACLGDTITYGGRLESPELDAYPVKLQHLLGEEYIVLNFGKVGAGLLGTGRYSIWTNLKNVRYANPDILIVNLGINDTVKKVKNKSVFYKAYIKLIETIEKWPSKPQIWICAPSPILPNIPNISSERKKRLEARKPILQKYIALIKKISNKYEVGFIDLNTPLTTHPNYFVDGVHLTKKGYAKIADIVYKTIK